MGLMRFTGPDALSFLQGQLSNDTRRLEKGSPLLAAYSTPQGRVVAVLHVLPHSSGVIAILPREILLPTLERLRKFVLRAKVTVEDVSEHYVLIGLHDPSGLRSAGLGIPDAASGYLEQDGIGIGRVSSRSSRHWVIGSAADRRSIHSPASARAMTATRSASSGTGVLRTSARGCRRSTRRLARCSSRRC